jgi:hypothetical protein
MEFRQRERGRLRHAAGDDTVRQHHRDRHLGCDRQPVLLLEPRRLAQLDKRQIGTASWTKSRPPAITRNSDGTETAWEQYGALHYAYNLDGTPTWYVSSVGFHPVVSSDLQLVTPRC